MNDNNTLSLLGTLERRKSRKQINADMRLLEKVINMLRLTGAFSEDKTKKELNSYIKTLQSQLAHIRLTVKIDRERIEQELDSTLRKMQWKDIDALPIDESKAKLRIRKAIAAMRAYADKIPVFVKIAYKRNKLSSDLSSYLDNNAKIKEFPSLEKAVGKVRELVDAMYDEKSMKEAVDAFRSLQLEVSAAGIAMRPTANAMETILGHIAQIPGAMGAASLAVNSFAKALKALRTKDIVFPGIADGLPEEAGHDSLPDVGTKIKEMVLEAGEAEQLDAWEERIQSLQSSWGSFMDALANRELVVNGVSYFDSLMRGAESLLDTIGEVPIVLAAINTAMTVKDKRYGITQLVNPETKKTDIQGNMLGIDFTAIKAQKQHFAEAGEAIVEWNSKLSQGQANINNFGNAVVENNAHLKEYLSSCSQEAPASLAGYKAYLNAAGVSTDALRLKTILLNTAIGIGIGVAVQAAVQGIMHLIQREENLRQATEQAANGYKESSSSIEGYISKYQELREALLMAIDNEEETYRIKKQLLELQTELNEKFGNEYGTVNLVAKAYKDQTTAIQALNKEAAQAFLNENREGINTAEKKMTKEHTYNLSYAGLNGNTDKGKALMEIAKKYEEQGIRLFDEYGDGNYLQFSIYMETDAQSAYKTINAFENDLREKARELGDENMFDDVLDVSSDSLNRAKAVIDKYGDIYRQSLAAEIASDDYKAIVYSDALEAVQAYNEAVLMSANPYDDQNVEQARADLERIKASIQDNEQEWGKYAMLFDDIFAQADTDLQAFQETLETDNGLGRLTEGLDAVSEGLVPVISKSVEQMAAQLAPQFAKLGEAYNEIFQFDDNGEASDGLRNIGNDMLEGLRQAFAEAEDETGVTFDASNLDFFFDALTDGSAATEQAKQAFNDLATAYLYSTDTLELLNSETESAITKQLEEMGVQNAAEIVASELAAKEQELAIAKEYLAMTGEELALATDNEANAFILEQIEAGNCGKELALLQLKKMLVNNTLLDTSTDINNVLALAQAAGITSEALTKIASLQASFDNAQAVGDYGAMNIISNEMAKAKSQLETDIRNFRPVEVRFDSKSAVKSARQAGKEAGKETGKSYKDALEEELRGLDSVISGITKAIDGQISSINGQKSAALDAIDAQKDALEDAKDAAVEALEAERDARLEVIEAQKEQLEEQAKAIDKQIESKQDEIDAINEAADARKRETDLQKAQYELERMQGQRAILQYSEDKGMHYAQDTSGIRDAKEQVDDAKREIGIAAIEKEIGLLEDQKSLLNEQMDLLDERADKISSFYDEEIEKTEAFYDAQIKALEEQRAQTEQYFDSIISNLESSKSRYEELTGLLDKAELSAKLRQLGIDEEALLSGSEEEFQKLKDAYLGIVFQLNEGNDAVLGRLQELSGYDGAAPALLADTAGRLDEMNGKLETSGQYVGDVNDALSHAAGMAGTAAGNVGLIADGLSQFPESETVTALANAFAQLAKSAGDVASALGISGDGTIGDFAQAIASLNDVTLEEGIIAQFHNLKDAIGSVALAISGGGSSGDSGAPDGDSLSGHRISGRPATKGAPGKGSGDSSGGSLADAIASLSDTARDTIGEAGAEGDGTVIGRFGSLETAVADVSGAIGSDAPDGDGQQGETLDGEDGGSLIGSIHGLGEKTTEILGEPGGKGAIGKFEQFKEPIREADEHVHSISDGLKDIDGKDVECSITINVRLNGSLGIIGNSMSLGSAVYDASYLGKAHAQGTALVSGNWAVQSVEGPALVGELGYEIVVRDGRFFTVGDNGAEMFPIKRGDIVFNHEQSRQLLKYGRISGRGKAYADGAVGGGKRLGPDGQVLMPIGPGDRAWELQKAFEPLIAKIDGNLEYLTGNALIAHDRQMEQMVREITNHNIINHITNKDIQPVVHNEIHVSLPNVTNRTSAEALLRDLQSLNTKKLQVNW